MNEIRLAQKGETARQKEIWKLCFGDSDRYIEFYYDNRYREEETALLLQDGEIAAMLTMLPVQAVTAAQRSFNSTMLYAIATHPHYRHRGYSTRLTAFAHQHLKNKESAFSVLVPAGKQLFEFYRRQGYQEAFYMREAAWDWSRIQGWPGGKSAPCAIRSVPPQEYNRIREKQLSGKLHIAYSDEDISYQQKLSRHTGADIYSLAAAGTQGCVVIERFAGDKVFIKELLMAEELMPRAVKSIAQLLPAQEYILRTPAFLGQQLEGALRPYGMLRPNQEIPLDIAPKNCGYLGLAFD